MSKESYTMFERAKNATIGAALFGFVGSVIPFLYPITAPVGFVYGLAKGAFDSPKPKK